jgi:hypothetical protein
MEFSFLAGCVMVGTLGYLFAVRPVLNKLGVV